jgi:N-methylhydantoinase A/acetophenone carboxylase
VETVKVSTTPHDLTVCFLECIRSGARRLGVAVEDLLYGSDIIRFANTIGTNTIIQRDGSKVGLILTAGKEGFAPVHRGDGKAPLIQPDMVFGLDEAVSPDGTPVRVPDERAALACAQELIDRGARCLVVAFANSEFNPENERLIRRVVKREYPRDFLGSVPVFLSSDISRRSGEAERINAAVLNAYIHAKLVRLLYKAGEELRRSLYRKHLFIVHNNGAVARVARTRSINTYNSGPAAGLLGARLIGRLYGRENLISADMGGTSFDIGSVRSGQVSLELNPEVEGFAVNVPMLAVRAIGAGGGSIASVKDGALAVGPQSAGALPGPVCFDLGGAEPTVTDADLILGILDPGYFLGGSMKLNADRALAVMEEKIGKPLGLPAVHAAMAIKKMIDEAMGREIKRLKKEIWPSGENPPLLIYGGAGPAHCCNLAETAGIDTIIITPFSAVFSAFAASGMDVGHLYYRRVDLPFAALDQGGVLLAQIAAMHREATRDMRGEGFAPEHTIAELDLLVQSAGGGPEVQLTVAGDCLDDPARIKKEAHAMLQAAGHSMAGEWWLATVSLRVRAEIPRYAMAEYPPSSRGSEPARKGRRKVFLAPDGGAAELSVYDGRRLEHGHQIAGPALVETEHSTLFIAAGWKAAVDRYHNTILTRTASEG